MVIYMEEKDIEERIKILIEKIRPFLMSDGGDIKYVKYENNILYISLIGACKDCSLIDVTLKDGIEEMIISEIPEIIEVKNI